MPLETAVKRNGRTLTLNWDYNMLSIMYSTCVELKAGDVCMAGRVGR
jgi:hypothetical protein